ncbi:MAG: flavodoxin [Lachnospiraceae bacterium]|nr:flavodoxin [Lachnospiraceae bacterium]
MTTAIVYYSQHHSNTKKLLDAICDVDMTVTLINAAEKIEVDLRNFDRIGFASGIYYSNYAKQVLNFASVNLPAQKPVFFIATCGAKRDNYFDSIKEIAKKRDCTDLGSYLCFGYDTFGPFKLVGGLKKGHPTDEEIQGAVDFYCNLGRES